MKERGKLRHGMRDKRLVISLLAKRCESEDQWELARVAATFWAERQVRAGGGAKRRLTCLLLRKERESQAKRTALPASCFSSAF